MHDGTENATLKMLLQGTDPSYRSGATQYICLFKSDPGETGLLTGEADYEGYLRVALTKASAWTDGGSTFTNANLVQFGACTAGTNVLTNFAIVDTSSGAISMMISGALTSPLTVSSGIQPQFSPGSLSIAAQ